MLALLVYMFAGLVFELMTSMSPIAGVYDEFDARRFEREHTPICCSPKRSAEK
jgi:hypothetical protein